MAAGPPYALRLRRLNRTPGANYETFEKGIEHPDPAICANLIAGMIKVTCYLLDKQIERLEQDFLKAGGRRERLPRPIRITETMPPAHRRPCPESSAAR